LFVLDCWLSWLVFTASLGARRLRTNEGLGGLFESVPTQISVFRSWIELIVVMAFWGLAIVFVALITGLIIDTFASAP
jgi:hypothetical protein